MKFDKDLLWKAKWHLQEVYAYCLDYINQLKNWLNGTYCLYFSEGFYLDSVEVDDIIIWVGPNKRQNFKRIFVSNKIKDLVGSNLVMLRIPEMIWLGKTNPNVLTPEKKKQIEDWVKKNLQAVLIHCEMKTYHTRKFFDSIE